MKKTLIAGLIIVCIGAITIGCASKQNDNSSNTNITQNSTGNGNQKTTEEQKDNPAVTNETKKEVVGEKIDVSIGSVEGEPDSTVLVPISLKGVPAKGVGVCNFTLKYDTNILEAVEVKGEDNIGTSTEIFDSSINSNAGTVVFLFTAGKGEKSSINKDGVFANVKFKIKKDAKKGQSKVTHVNSATFGDTELNKMNPVFTEGEVKVN